MFSYEDCAYVEYRVCLYKTVLRPLRDNTLILLRSQGSEIGVAIILNLKTTTWCWLLLIGMQEASKYCRKQKVFETKTKKEEGKILLIDIENWYRKRDVDWLLV